MLPRLTKEEWAHFMAHDKDFFERYHLREIIALHRRIGYALHNLAVRKLVGDRGFRHDKQEAIAHHLKACQYDPFKAYLSIFRKSAGLLVYQEPQG